MFFSDSVTYPLFLLGGGLAVYAAGCRAPSWGCTFYAFDRCRYSVPFWPAAAGERSVSPAQHMWDWKESDYFYPVISTEMEKLTCMCAAGASFSASPRLPHYTTHPCVPMTSDIREMVNKWHQLLNGKEPSVVLEMWCHGWRCQWWDSGLLSPPLLVNRFCSEIRWWLISASSADRWSTNERSWCSWWCAGSVVSWSGQRAASLMSSVLTSSQRWCSV